jgi:hypothetical protein
LAAQTFTSFRAIKPIQDWPEVGAACPACDPNMYWLVGPVAQQGTLRAIRDAIANFRHAIADLNASLSRMNATQTVHVKSQTNDICIDYLTVETLIVLRKLLHTEEAKPFT